MAEVVLEKVSKIYAGGISAVKSIDLEIRDRELMVLVGPSGCGKSSTLRMVAGLEEISEGVCRIGGRLVNDVPPKDRDIAMVFQNYALYPHMTVYNNMAFGLKLRKFSRREIDERVTGAAAVLGLSDLLSRRPKALSGGQRQRVAMGRAIVREPAVFLFDEPLSNLDAKMRVEMRKEILHLHKRIDATMIYVTHDQVEAMTLGDRITVMNDGRIEQVGTPGEVFNRPASLFVAGFIGTPPMNILEGGLIGGDGQFVFEGGEVRFSFPHSMSERIKSCCDRKVYLGIRPGAFVTADKADSGQKKNAIRADVELTEMLGEEKLLHLKAGGHRFIASVNPDELQDGQSPITICPVMEKSHIFDGETGCRVS